MKNRFRQWAGAIVIGALCMSLAGTAAAVDPGLGVGAPGPGVTPGVGAPGVGAVDPGINQPGAAGNVGVGAPGVGVGAPGVGVVDPGLNQPGVVGNVGGVARRSVRR
jgi:hypothetical protein